MGNRHVVEKSLIRNQQTNMPFTYYDFFAGGGMVDFGLGSKWRCTFANEIDDKKARAYRANSQCADELKVSDVATLKVEDLPGSPDLVWASFPCQDLSVAGVGRGLTGERSGTFQPFWSLVKGLVSSDRAPKIVALENVCGAIRSNGGRDFATLAAAFNQINYRFGALVVDAVHFVPQSRPRFFMLGIRPDIDVPSDCVDTGPSPLWHSAALTEGTNLLSAGVSDGWIWWHLPQPVARNTNLSSIVEDEPSGVEWNDDTYTDYLISMMSDVNLEKLRAAQAANHRVVGTVYRRTRTDATGKKMQRAEVRFDGVAGCLRTPAGGSSRQTLLVVDGQSVRSRLLSPREAATLMGLPEHYQLPERYNEAYKLTGDGVVAPVVRHLAEHIFEPVLERNKLTLVA